MRMILHQGDTHKYHRHLSLFTALFFFFLPYSLLLMTAETFTGYAALEPLNIAANKTKLEKFTFEARPLEADEVEVLVSACGM